MDAELTSSAVVSDAAQSAFGFALSSPSPTPSRSQATVTLRLGAAQQVTAEVFDVRGRRVATLYDGPLRPGVHPLVVDVGALSAGVYLVRAQGDVGVASTRLVALGR